jgi:ATP-dependent RNA helicase DDX24/MAK5
MRLMIRLSDEDDDPDAPYAQRKKFKGGKKRLNISKLKADLKTLLAEPLMARGVSARYPTSGTRVIVDELINSTGGSKI